MPSLTTCYWQTAALMHYLRGLYDKDRHPSQPAIDVELKWLCKCSLLILDDLGTDVSTEGTTSILDQIVDTRYINLNHINLNQGCCCPAKMSP